MYCIVEYVEDTQTFLSCPTFNSAPRRARSGPKIASFSLRFPLRPRGPSSSQASGAQVEQERLMLCSCLFMKNIKVPQRFTHPLLYALDKVILLSSTWARHPTPLPWYPESPRATRPSQMSMSQTRRAPVMYPMHSLGTLHRTTYTSKREQKRTHL